MPTRQEATTKRLFGLDAEHPHGDIVWPTLRQVWEHLEEHEDIYVLPGVAKPDNGVRATAHHLDMDLLASLVQKDEDEKIRMRGFILIGYTYDLHAKFQCEPF